MATCKVPLDSQQLFDQHGVPADARSVQDARHKMMRARSLASHRATAALTCQTLIHLIRMQCEHSR